MSCRWYSRNDRVNTGAVGRANLSTNQEGPRRGTHYFLRVPPPECELRSLEAHKFSIEEIENYFAG
jgi:hypothetical protein